MMKAIVVTDGLYVRDRPSSLGNVKDGFVKGDELDVLDLEHESWLHVQLAGHPERNGWVYRHCIKMQSAEDSVEANIEPAPATSVSEIVFWAALVVLFASVLAWSAWGAEVPDPSLTPGACKTMSIEELCKTKWGKDKRHVTAAMKMERFHAYGLSGNRDSSCKCKRHFEIDHLCSRELGGLDVVSNLWPQCYCGDYNAVMKDRVENRLHKEVCAGNITLEDAQKEITTDWRVPYRRYFGGK